MTRFNKRLPILAVLAFLAAMLGFTTSTSAAPAAKVDVCHVDGQGNFSLINVSENAFQAHVDHGDASPGDPVPGMDGYTFDDSCTPVADVVDTDGDGIADNDDNCPTVANPNQVDTDLDELGDACDDDDDGDGVSDGDDAFPLNPDESVDTDGDGIGNNADNDDDDDGLSDTDEATVGTDPLNPDTDGDGILDGDDLFPLGGCIENETELRQAASDGGDYCITGTIDLLNGEVTVNSTLSLTSGDAGSATINANNVSRVLLVTDTGVLALTNITITGGVDLGGGIWNNGGMVTLNDSSSITNNNTHFLGGGIWNNGGMVTLNDSSSITNNNSVDVLGGGIYNDDGGTVTLNDNSSISDNSITSFGGGIYNNGGMVTLNDSSSITNNNTAFSDGGGIYNDNGGTVTLNDSSSITNNTAFGGGGIFNDGGTVTLWSPLLAVFDNNPDDCFNC